MTELDEDLKIDKGCVLILEAGNSLGCTDVTICKGMLIYHKYQRVKKEYDTYFYLFATAALTLSIQICEEKIKTEDVLKTFKALGPQVAKDKDKGVPLAERMMPLQYDIFRVVFDCPYKETTTHDITDELNCETAHKYVFPYLKLFASFPGVHKNIISLQTWTLRLLSTFYHCRRCTSYDSLEVALATLRLAFYLCRIEAKHMNMLQKEISASSDERRIASAVNDIILVSDVGTINANYSLPE